MAGGIPVRGSNGGERMEDAVQKHISKTPGVCGGKACIAGHRIRVMDIVVLHEMRGMSRDEHVSSSCVASSEPSASRCTRRTVRLSSTCAVFQGYHEQRESRQKGLRSSILGVEQTTPDHRARRHRWTVYRRPLSLCCCTWLLPSPNRLSAARSCCCSPPC